MLLGAEGDGWKKRRIDVVSMLKLLSFAGTDVICLYFGVGWFNVLVLLK